MLATRFALALLLSACSPSVEATPINAGPSASAIPTPDPTADVEAIADAYLQMANETNEEACRFIEARRGSPSDLELITMRAEEFADAVRVSTDAVRELAFPPRPQDRVDEFLEIRERIEAALRAVAASGDQASLDAALDDLDQASTGGAVIGRVIRKELGLPAVPSDPCDG
jgi:hypothetical protein